jgi:Family of unknown function (DUF6401)
VGVRRLDRSSRRVLDRLHERVGAAGLAAAAAVPGLGAVVDQHAAAVRDILTTGVQSGAAVAGTVLLAGYAQGVLDHLRESGRSSRVPADLAGWRRADWASVRLLAVCSLARNLRPGHRIGSTDDLPSLG